MRRARWDDLTVLMLRRTATVFLVCLPLLAATACGDDHGGAATGASGVAGAKQIKALSRAELVSFCRWTEEQHVLALPVRVECEGENAVWQTLTKADCETARDECMASEPTERSEALTLWRARCDASEVVPRENCSSTVAEFEACIHDVIAAERAFYGALTCDMVPTSIEDYVADPPSCAGIDRDCKP